MKKLLLLFPFLFLLVNSANAQTIWSSNATGSEKNLFYSNESVYVTSRNISTTTITVDIYVVNDSNAWINNTVLTSYGVSATGTVTTNASGYIEPTLIWSSLITGSYDIVVDVNRDGNYTSNVDYVDNLTVAGFTVVAVPVPTLTFSVGPKSPSDHIWNVSSTGDNVMLQLKVKADNENVKINSFDMTASGSGDDKTGISLIRLTLDDNNNGIYESNETLLGYGKFNNDNGVLILSIGNGYTIPTGATTYFLFLYTMSSSVSAGNNFSFQILSSSAVGASSGKTAKLGGLPINSAVKTIAGNQTVNQTVICSTYTNQTSCSNAGCSWCNTTNSCKNVTESCPSNCSGSVALSLEKYGNTSTARISGLSNCNGEIVYLRQDNCTGLTVGNCSVSGAGCWISFSTPDATGNYTYSACVDKDASGSYTSGESTSSVLTVSPAEEITKPSIDWNMIILIIAIVALVVITTFVIFWFKKARTSKPYTYEFKP